VLIKLIRPMFNALKFVSAGVIGFVKLTLSTVFFNIFETRRKVTLSTVFFNIFETRRKVNE